MTTHQSRSLGTVPPQNSGAGEHQSCPPDLLPVEQINLVERTHKEFLQALALELSRYLETRVAASFLELQQMSLMEFLADRDSDCLVVLNLDSVPGLAFFSLQNEFVARVLGFLLGAPAQSTAPSRNAATEIELHILQGFFDSLLRTLDKAWESCGADFKLVSIGAQPPDQVAQAADHSMIVITSTVEFEEGEASSFRLAVPALLVRVAAMQVLQPASPRVPGLDSEILASLRTAGLQVEAVLGGSTLRMSDLLAMEPGQILKLGNQADSSFDCVVNGKAKFRGELIHVGDRQALQIGARVLPTRGQA